MTFDFEECVIGLELYGYGGGLYQIHVWLEGDERSWKRVDLLFTGEELGQLIRLFREVEEQEEAGEGYPSARWGACPEKSGRLGQVGKEDA